MAKLAPAEKAEDLRQTASFIEILGNETVIGENVTLSSLVDEYCHAKQAENHAKALAEMLKEVIRSRIEGNPRSLDGEKFLIKITESSRSSLNGAAVEKLLTPEQLASCYRSTDIVSWGTVRK
ncbi:MAG: hypothetical protein ACRDBG_01905 [Waterburya sp.]